MTVQLLHIAAEETNKESNPLLLPAFTLAGVIVGIAGQWLVAHFNRKHERGLADLAARREAYARFRTALHTLADIRQKLDQSRKHQKVIDDGLKHDFFPGHSRQKYLDMQTQLLASYQASVATVDQALRDLYEAQTLVDILGTAPVRGAANTLREIVSSNPPDDTDADKWTAEAEYRFVRAVRQEFGTKGSHTVDGDSGHSPYPMAVISQPKLPGLSDRHPDFMWIAAHSTEVFPILIEVETPHRRWFYGDRAEIHSDLAHAQGQLAEWRAWFDTGYNRDLFIDQYGLRSFMEDRKLSPRGGFDTSQAGWVEEG